MIAVIDYGLGNLRSAQKAFESLGYDAVITSDPDIVRDADRVVLPGQGAFPDCYKGLKNSGMYDATIEAMDSGKPFLGICVGMQLLMEKSYEYGEHEGIGFFKGSVKKFPDKIVKEGMKIPHMGWNTVEIEMPDHPVFKGIDSGSYFYFVHSYYVDTPDSSIIAASCNYGAKFTAVVAKDNVVAAQFHPEKSQEIGLRMLKNFAEMKLL